MNDQLEPMLDYPQGLPAGLFGTMPQPILENAAESDGDPVAVESEGGEIG